MFQMVFTTEVTEEIIIFQLILLVLFSLFYFFYRNYSNMVQMKIIVLDNTNPDYIQFLFFFFSKYFNLLLMVFRNFKVEFNDLFFKIIKNSKTKNIL